MKRQLKLVEPEALPLEYDGSLLIATGKSRFETAWKNKKLNWSALLAKLSHSLQTQESHAEYMKMSKEDQDRIKDIGGFVGGHLKEGRRKTGYVAARQILTLDLDFPPENFWEGLMDNFALTSAMAVYSTHKHTEAKPRYRLIIPLDRDVTPDEYEAIARKMAEKIGIDYFDDTTFQPTRLMYWPSHSADVVPVFEYYDAPFLSANGILAEYPDWTDTSYWPESSRMVGVRKKQADKQGDPTAKKGVVGAFCRTYTITQAIAKFLPEVYTPTSKDDRYTYAAGSTAAGLVVYDGDLFAFSNHSTDPAGGQLCNAFDLVRIHLFGDLDNEAPRDARGTKLPSYKAMIDMVRSDESTKLTLGRERTRAQDDFAEPIEEDDKWLAKLEVNASGAYTPSARNAMTIFENDPALKGIALNELSGMAEITGRLPWERSRMSNCWREQDRAQLLVYMHTHYQAKFPQSILDAAFDTITDRRRFNPLVDYVRGLPDWDGVERVDTLLIDYLGAEDSKYTRAVTRKTLVGAIQRVLEPGCKFDTMLVLDGKSGIGKSTLLSKLGGKWFDDSLSLADTRDKTAAEKLQGKWIMEIGEMQGTRKSDIDVDKGFLSRQDDAYRAAYGRVVQSHPRTCIICGTTNSTDGFLRDTTGNRRFWPVNTPGGGRLSVWDMAEETRAQIWAEAFAMAAEGETTYLDKAMEDEAVTHQRRALEYDEREPRVSEYLETLLPADWYSWTFEKRVDFFQQRDELRAEYECTLRREVVCAEEIFCEGFGRPRNAFDGRRDGYEIKQLMCRMEGWQRSEKTKKIRGYGKPRVYIRGAGDKISNDSAKRGDNLKTSPIVSPH